MAELRPYNPTWRDRIAQTLMGDGRASPERRTFVEGLLGSSGLGSTGGGLIDFTPAGVPLAGQEFQRAKDEGDTLGAFSSAMALIPAAKLPTSVAKGAAQGIRAYHGSPHSFDRFDLSKIGTGEGAQAYGHGLYFAEQEPVAKGYRDALSLNNKQWLVDGSVVGRYGENATPIGRAASWLRASMPENGVVTPEHAEAAKAKFSNMLARNKGIFSPESSAETLKNIDALVGRTVDEKLPGSMYEVNIRADPNAFLDWDKPLREQPEQVRRLAGWTPEAEAQYRAALKADTDALFAALEGGADYKAKRFQAPQGAAPMDWTGAQFYKSSKLVPGDYRDKVAATERLREAGVPGIKYLDQGSRAAGEGSRNYVVFDDSLIDILRKYGIVGLLGGGAAGAGMLGPQDGVD